MADRKFNAFKAPIRIRPGEDGHLIVHLAYRPERVEKIKSVPGPCWNPAKTYWTVPHTEGIIAYLRKLFVPEVVEIDPSLRPGVELQADQKNPPLAENREAQQALEAIGQDTQAQAVCTEFVAPSGKPLTKTR